MNNNENIQKNEIISDEIISFSESSLFDLNIGFDQKLGFTAFNEF